MAATFIGGAALGSAFSELYNAVIVVAKQNLHFRSNLKTLSKTLASVKPVFDEIGKLNRVLNRPQEETDRFIERLNHGVKLVAECSTIQFWNAYKTYVFSKKLVELDRSLSKFFHIDVQGLVAVNSMKSLVELKNFNDKLDIILSLLRISGGGLSVHGGCSVPGLPDFIVGLDGPLRDLKAMLLKDAKPVVVLSAPGGCGKTTLAKMLCRDPEIEGIFGENILFVTVSKTANLNVIVQKIFKHHVPDLQSDEDAINCLEHFLKQKGPSPILLVLDDVWPDEESFIDNFTFKLPNYKILVTSRYNLVTRFGSTYNLNILNDQDSMTLFRQSALPKDGSSKVPDYLVKKIVKGCKGFPLALTLVGRSLHGRPEVIWRREQKKWSDGKSIFDTNSNLLCCLQTSLDALDDITSIKDTSIKDCCLDLGSFPEDQMIPATTLMDMWAELYNLDHEDMDTLAYLVELAIRNLVNLVSTRNVGSEVDSCCNENFVTQHDLLRELAIHLSNSDPIEHRKRLILEIRGNDLPQWWIEKMHQPIYARLLSISTDKKFSSNWHDMQFPEAEVLILNFCSSNYTLPQFIERMYQLKVLVVTNYGFSACNLYNFQLLGCLSNIRRIRLERVSISSLDMSLLQMMNLRKISLTMCEIGKAFENGTVDIPHVFPNLLEIEIDCCDDLVKLPVGLCNIGSLKKISITYCNGLYALPEEIGRLTNLEVLRLNSCTKLVDLPESIGSLHKLIVLDTSDCLNLSKMPDRVGELCNLRRIHMRGCQGLSELQQLPPSVKDLRLLEEVTCDEGTSHLWKPFQGHLTDLNVLEVQEDVYGNLMRVISPIKIP